MKTAAAPMAIEEEMALPRTALMKALDVVAWAAEEHACLGRSELGKHILQFVATKRDEGLVRLAEGCREVRGDEHFRL